MIRQTVFYLIRYKNSRFILKSYQIFNHTKIVIVSINQKAFFTNSYRRSESVLKLYAILPAYESEINLYYQNSI